MALDARAMASDAVAAKPANPLLAGPILPTLLRLTLPNLAAMLVMALVAIFETVYVGMLGTTPLAAIALVFPLIMLMQMFSAGAMGGGVSSAISRALGPATARARRSPCTPLSSARWPACFHRALHGVRRPDPSACSVAPARCSSRRWSIPTSPRRRDRRFGSSTLSPLSCAAPAICGCRR